MGVDGPRQHELAGGIDDLAPGKVAPEGRDGALGDAQIGLEGAGGGDERAAADDDVESVHLVPRNRRERALHTRRA